MTHSGCPAAAGTARHGLPRTARVAAALIVLAGLAAAPSVHAATTRHLPDAHAAGLSCSLASAKLVRSALGITVGSPTVTRNGPVTVCQFRSSPALLVRFETAETAALFAAGRKGFAQHGEPTKSVSGLGTKAYSSSFGGSNTIVVLQRSTELLALGQVPLAKLEALARLILPLL